MEQLYFSKRPNYIMLAFDSLNIIVCRRLAMKDLAVYKTMKRMVLTMF